MSGRRAEPSYGAVEKWARARGDGRTRLQLAMPVFLSARNNFLLLEEAEPRGRRQACQARVKERGPSLEGPLGKGLLSLADCAELRRASRRYTSGLARPVAAGRRGRLPH